MQTQYERLTDPQWKVIKEHLPIQRKCKYNLREIVDGILWVLRVGNQWRNMPENFPPWRNRSSLKAWSVSIYYYFSRWQTDQTLEKLNWALNRLERKRLESKIHPVCFVLILSL